VNVGPSLENFRRDAVIFRADYERWALEKLWLIPTDFLAKHFELTIRFNAIERDQIDEKAQHSRPFDMTQELVAKSTPFTCSFDEARNVSHHELNVVA
jgi:hypothetical protein